MSKTNSLTEGKVAPALLKFMLPIMMALILQSAYGIVDLWAVSNYSAVGDISGVTIASQFMTLVINSCAGLSMGTTILLGLYIGAQEPDKASRTIGASIMMFALISLVVTIGLFFGSNSIVTITQTPTEAVTPANNYLKISAIGATFLIFYNLLGSIFRGIGDSKTPLISVGISCVINIVLDLVFVAMLNLGAAGAALATTISQGVSVIICVLFIRRKKLPFQFKKEYLTLNPFYTKEIFRLGFPMALQTLLASSSFVAITTIINTFGVYASSAVGIVQKINSIIMLVSNSFMQTLSAFVAQNRGARQMDRAKHGLFIGVSLSFCTSLILGYLTWFHGIIFVNIFTTDPQLVEKALEFLRAYSIEGVMVAIYFCMLGYFNGCGKTTFTSIQGTFISIFVRIPLTYLFSRLSSNMTIVGLGVPICTAIQIFICIFYYRRLEKKGWYTLAQ